MSPMHMLLGLILLLGISLCQNAVDMMVETMETIGKKHVVTMDLEEGFLKEINNYGNLVESVWENHRDLKEKSMKKLVNMNTLRKFVSEVISESEVDLDAVELKDNEYRTSISHVPKIRYEEAGDKVIVHLRTYHKIYENGNYPSCSVEIVENLQKSMTLLLILLDICGSTNRARDVLTKTPLTLEQDYGVTHYVFKLCFELSFETERQSFEKFQDAIKGLKELPWVLERGTKWNVTSDLNTTLYAADEEVIRFLEPLLGESESEYSTESD